MITGKQRTNGQSCPETADPNIRYLATEYGQERPAQEPEMTVKLLVLQYLYNLSDVKV